MEFAPQPFQYSFEIGEVDAASFLTDAGHRPTAVQHPGQAEPFLPAVFIRRLLLLPKYLAELEDSYASFSLPKVQLQGTDEIAQQAATHLGVFRGEWVYQRHRGDVGNEAGKQRVETGGGETQFQRLR